MLVAGGGVGVVVVVVAGVGVGVVVVVVAGGGVIERHTNGFGVFVFFGSKRTLSPVLHIKDILLGVRRPSAGNFPG